jgi:DNA-binding response OmpR family regulator
MTTPNDFHNARILIVDDCWDTASSLTELLAVRGYQSVCWTTDGEAVCQLHAGDHYDLIVLDMHMPEVSGLDVMKRLRMSKLGCRVSIIGMTGDEFCRMEALGAGASACLMKPFEFPELECRIHQALSLAWCRSDELDTAQAGMRASQGMEMNIEEALPFSTLDPEYGGPLPHSTSI